MRDLLTLLILTFFSLSLSSQNEAVIDSLKLALEQTDTKPQKVYALAKLTKKNLTQDYTKGIENFRQLVKLAGKNRLDSLEADCYAIIGASFANLGQADSATVNLLKSREHFKAIKNIRGEINTLGRLTWVTRNLRRNYPKSIELAFEALKLSESIGFKIGEAMSMRNVAFGFSSQRNYEESSLWARKAIALADEIGNKTIKEATMLVLANNYGQQFKHEEAIEIFNELIDSSETGKNIANAASFRSNRGKNLIHLEKYDEALLDLHFAYKIYSENATAQLPNVISSFGECYLKQGKYELAIEKFEEVLGFYKEKEVWAEMQYLYYSLADAYYQMGDYKNAMENHILLKEVSDSLFSEEKYKITNELNTQYETEKKEQEIALLSEKEKVQTAQITSARNRNSLLLALLALLLAGGGAIYYRRQLSEQMRLQTMRSQISSDLHDEVGSSLAQLSMIMGSVEDSDSASAKKYLRKGNEILMSSISKIRDVVWAIDATNDEAGSLIDRMEDFAYDMFSAKEIKYKINTDGFDRKEVLPPNIRQNFYLFYKEAVTNIHKHSNATEVNIDISRKGKKVSLTVADNGQDLNDKKVTGSGISNMELRAKKIGGTFDMQKGADGFMVKLEVAV